MAPNTTQRVCIQDKSGKYGRLRFVGLFKSSEWRALRDNAKQALGDDTVQVVDGLPRHADFDELGWWVPADFQQKPCETEIPDSIHCDAQGLGWHAALVLREKEKQILAFLDAYADQNDLGKKRQDSLRYNEEFYPGEPGKGIRLENPFDRASGIKRMLEDGARVEVETPQQFLETTNAVIYSTIQDSYLTQQGMWKGLNRARLFISAKEAEDHIKQNRLTGCTIALTETRVATFLDRGPLGPKACEAWSRREADELKSGMQEVKPAASRPARRF